MEEEGWKNIASGGFTVVPSTRRRINGTLRGSLLFQLHPRHRRRRGSGVPGGSSPTPTTLPRADAATLLAAMEVSGDVENAMLRKNRAAATFPRREICSYFDLRSSFVASQTDKGDELCRVYVPTNQNILAISL